MKSLDKKMRPKSGAFPKVSKPSGERKAPTIDLQTIREKIMRGDFSIDIDTSPNGQGLTICLADEQVKIPVAVTESRQSIANKPKLLRTDTSRTNRQTLTAAPSDLLSEVISSHDSFDDLLKTLKIFAGGLGEVKTC